ncbi:MAG: hypothetical protein ABFD59_08295 [Smithella sp.]
MGFSVAELKAIASLDSKQFEMGAARVKSSMSGIVGGQMKQMAGMIGSAFAMGALVNFSKNTMKVANDLQEVARGLGISTESLQALQYTAERAGASSDGMTLALRRIQKAQDGVAGGNERLREAATALGYTWDGFINSRPDEIFERMSQRMNDSNATAEEGKATGDILGRGYTSLRATMQDVAAEGLDPMIEKLKTMNQIMTEDSVNAAAAMELAWERASRSVTNYAREQAIEVIKAVKTASAYLGAMWVTSGTEEGNAIQTVAARIAAQIVGQELGAPPARPKPPKPTAASLKPPKIFEADLESITVDMPKAADRLAKIGGMIGGQTSTERGIAQRQLKEQEAIRKATEKTAEAAEKSAESNQKTVEVLLED